MADVEALAPSAWSSMDDESLDTILSLLREDVSLFVSSSKGKQVEGAPSDADLALQLYTEELSRATIYASDRRMTKSIQGAVQEEANALLESEQVESMTRSDRQFAIDNSAVRPQTQAQKPADTGHSKAELETFEKLSAIYVKGVDETDGGGDEFGNDIETMSTGTSVQAESSSWASSPRKHKKPQRRPCIACGDVKHFIDLARAPCGHEYCRECLASLFQHAMLDESLFPPRCCRQTIPVDTNRLFLSSDLVQQFQKKSIELSTSNRTYCHRSTCSTFVPPSMIKDGIASCPECNTQTCATCKEATHGGDCPSDTELQRVLQVARDERWQRCRKCFTMVELTTGCFHITCKCGSHFCYRCGAKWKTCQCAHWEEHRLYERAAEIYNRDHNPGEDVPGPVVVNPQVPRLANPQLIEPANRQTARPMTPQTIRPVNRQTARPMIPQTIRPVIPRHIGPVNPQPVAPQVDRENIIGRIMEHLLYNHECDHDRWKGRPGPEDCEECGDTMPIFIYECRQCRIMACRRCRYNRL